MPESVRRAVAAFAEEMRKTFHRGDLVVVDWLDAADEKQVVHVKREKVPTPVRTVGFFYDVVDHERYGPRLTIVGHIFDEKWKDMTYIPVAWIRRIEVRQDGMRQRLMGKKTWGGHAHTRKVRIGKRTWAIHLARVRAVLGRAEVRGSE